MTDLLLTLGHNASAIAVELDGSTARVLNAYELERLSGVKSDSRFPVDAIAAIKERCGDITFDRIYVTHWDPMNQIDGLKTKYWDRSFFPKDVPVFSQEMLGLTHHDCHAYAALAFAGEDFPKHDTGILVLDGFGNYGEHMSYYRLNEQGHPQLVRRVHGYYTSLGLMYQYATAFLGMKMHEDEYKLLGYGARVGALGLNVKELTEIAIEEAQRHMRSIRLPDSRLLGTDLSELPNVQEMWGQRFAAMLDRAGLAGTDHESEDARIVLGFLVQMVLEIVMQGFIHNDVMLPTNLIVTGGVAYNVALNRVLMNLTQGKACFMPLAGDQGNSLGLWAFHNKRVDLDFGDLCWGIRDLDNADNRTPPDLPDGLVFYAQDCPEVAQLIRDELASTGFVNVVRGRMEFGPRALCNTTTLARADDPNIAAEINRINGRNSVMPFAPVVWHEHLEKVFPAAGKLHKSERFMICATDYNPSVGSRFPGAALHTALGKVTGRPQSYAPKYEGDSVARVLQEYGLLINTSFNVHGVPICLDLKDVVHSHQYQRERNPKVRTIVIAN